MNAFLSELQPTNEETTSRQAIGLLADFTVDGERYRKNASNAPFEWVDHGRLADFFRERDAKLNFTFPNTLAGGDVLSQIRLSVSSPTDFDRARISEEAHGLKELERVRQLVDRFICKGIFRDVARWILTAPDLTFAASRISPSKQTRYKIPEESAKQFESFELGLTDIEKGIWIVAKEMLGTSKIIEDVFATVTIAGQLLGRDELIANERLLGCDRLMEKVSQQLTRKIDEQVRAIEAVPRFQIRRDQWRGLERLARDMDVAILDTIPGQLARRPWVSGWKCWSSLGTQSEHGDIRWCDQVAAGPRTLKCLVVDAHLGIDDSSWHREILYRCAQIGLQLQIPVIVSMRSELFETWRAAVESSDCGGTEEGGDAGVNDSRFGEFANKEWAAFLVAARCAESLAPSNSEESDGGSEAVGEDGGFGYYESLSLALMDPLIPTYASKPNLAVSRAWTVKTRLDEIDALVFLFWLSRASCICRRAAIQAATQDSEHLVGVLRSLFRQDLLPSLRSLNNPFSAGNPDIFVTRNPSDGRRFNCTFVFENSSFRHVFTVHRQTWLP